MHEKKQLSILLGGQHLWGWGFFITTYGNIMEELIMEYIENQDKK